MLGFEPQSSCLLGQCVNHDTHLANKRKGVNVYAQQSIPIICLLAAGKNSTNFEKSRISTLFKMTPKYHEGIN